MILIADSGSTKTDWLLTSEDGKTENSCTTKGINPFYQNSDEILVLLQNELAIPTDKVNQIHFYGAGCANEEKNKLVQTALNVFIPKAEANIYSDLLGAAHALCGNQQGIACILGTGSNSCLYNGKTIVHNVSPLGYIIGDEGSGAVIGKLLISDILKKQLPHPIIETFFNEYNTSRDEILNHIYKQPFANRYLAQFSKFIYKNIHYPELETIVINSFNSFISRNLLQYNDIKYHKIHFTGSIAYYFKEQLSNTLQNYNLTLGNIYKSPMNGLAKYHATFK